MKTFNQFLLSTCALMLLGACSRNIVLSAPDSDSKNKTNSSALSAANSVENELICRNADKSFKVGHLKAQEKIRVYNSNTGNDGVYENCQIVATGTNAGTVVGDKCFVVIGDMRTEVTVSTETDDNGLYHASITTRSEDRDPNKFSHLKATCQSTEEIDDYVSYSLGHDLKESINVSIRNADKDGDGYINGDEANSVLTQLNSSEEKTAILTQAGMREFADSWDDLNNENYQNFFKKFQKSLNQALSLDCPDC